MSQQGVKLAMPSADVLRVLYAETGSRLELGRRLGVSDVTAANWLRRAGVAMNPVGKAPRSPWREGLGRKR